MYNVMLLCSVNSTSNIVDSVKDNNNSLCTMYLLIYRSTHRNVSLNAVCMPMNMFFLVTAGI